jgi:hypothetical protein
MPIVYHGKASAGSGAHVPGHVRSPDKTLWEVYTSRDHQGFCQGFMNRLAASHRHWGLAHAFEATIVEGFVQQLAVAYVARGYVFYVTGVVPPHNDPAAVGAKLAARYGAGLSKWARARRKAAGMANHAYLRYRRFFVLLTTHGTGPFFEAERNLIRDTRRTPLRFNGYSISFSGGHAHVRIDQRVYLELKAYLLGIAVHRAADDLAAEFRELLAFEPYAPVRSQALCILRAVNRARAAAGLPELDRTCLRLFRRAVKPFAPEEREPAEEPEQPGRDGTTTASGEEALVGSIPDGE